jgi:hypothetical protein
MNKIKNKIILNWLKNNFSKMNRNQIMITIKSVERMKLIVQL